MTTSDLTMFQDGDGFVLHFGGRPNEVNAYTFANALVAFSDAVREVNSQTSPESPIEIRLEALGPGSFRGKIRTVAKTGWTGLKWTSKNALLPILVAFIYDEYIDDDEISVEVKADEVIIQHGRDRVIVPRSAYDAVKNLPEPRRVHRQFNRTIDALEDDPSVTSFGLTPNLDDDQPLLNIDRSNWDAIRAFDGRVDDGPRRRVQTETVRLAIVKAVFATSSRKWEFAWRGLKISASIADAAFLADLMQRRYTIGNGDALLCDLEIEQTWSENEKVWLNSEYIVRIVREFIPQAGPGSLFGND